MGLKSSSDIHNFADDIEFYLIPLAFDLSIKVCNSSPKSRKLKKKFLER